MIVIASSKKNKKLLNEAEILAELRSFLENSSMAKDICSENNMPISFLSGVPISFDDMKESARTVNSSIFLNRKLTKKPMDIIKRYLIHEITHAIQHVAEPGASKEVKNKEYLDKDTEVEAFKNQISFQKKNEGTGRTNEYLEGLLDFHDLKGVKRKHKKKELLSE